MRKIFSNTLLVINLLSMWVSICFADGTEGVTPFNFLFLDSAARPAAMGGAYVAIRGGPETIDYNPAGISIANLNTVTFNYRRHFQDVNQQTAGLIFKSGYIKNIPGNLAFMLNTVSFGDINRTTLSNPGGSGLGDFTIHDWSLKIGYGQKVKDNLSFGLNIKYLSENIDNITGEAYAIDIGIMSDLNNYNLPINYGLVLQNIGTKVKFQSDRENLPINLKAGLAYNISNEKAIIALDINKPRYGETSWHTGFELKVFKYSKIRIGYNSRDEADSGLTFGIAGIYKDFSVEYSFIPYGDIGHSNIIGLNFYW